MNEMADKVYNKQEVPCTNSDALHYYHIHIIQQQSLHISNSKFCTNWHATATYVGMVVE